MQKLFVNLSHSYSGREEAETPLFENVIIQL